MSELTVIVFEVLTSIVFRMLYAPPKVIAPRLSTNALPAGAFNTNAVALSINREAALAPMLPVVAVKVALLTASLEPLASLKIDLPAVITAVPLVLTMLIEALLVPRVMSDVEEVVVNVTVPAVPAVLSAFNLALPTAEVLVKEAPLITIFPLVPAVPLVSIPPAPPDNPVRVTTPSLAPALASMVTVEPPVPVVFLALIV